VAQYQKTKDELLLINITATISTWQIQKNKDELLAQERREKVSLQARYAEMRPRCTRDAPEMRPRCPRCARDAPELPALSLQAQLRNATDALEAERALARERIAKLEEELRKAGKKGHAPAAAAGSENFRDGKGSKACAVQ